MQLIAQGPINCSDPKTELKNCYLLRQGGADRGSAVQLYGDGGTAAKTRSLCEEKRPWRGKEAGLRGNGLPVGRNFHATLEEGQDVGTTVSLVVLLMLDGGDGYEKECGQKKDTIPEIGIC
jgi:hypothetical protein